MESCPFPLMDFMSLESLGWIKNLESRAGDFYVCSYPKSGTTWMQHIVGSLVTKGAAQGHVSELTPFLEHKGHWSAGAPTEEIQRRHNSLKRRMFNTHVYHEMLPSGPWKCVYVVRDGRDVSVSFYHHLASQANAEGTGYVFEGSFADFHTKWCEGTEGYGTWANHIRSWSAARTDPRVLFVRYEDMIQNLRPVVDAVALHLGLELSATEIDELMPTFSMEHMKVNKDRFQPISVSWKPGFEFLRKGVAKDHVTEYTSKQQTEFADMVKNTYPSGELPKWTGYQL
eukprot:TRINITY_DN92661_c0_g1_i1.p1 TRINITY_DN92661_c0_g1~~TRINITY_DN92661_c0_g1_i1.p1  ORF type:complete len:294 (-),score=45.34 TRINITY_DN92661_c0_g1_i1:70-924(-)